MGTEMTAHNTTLINIWAGAGAGKSTTAADVFVQLKRAGASVELVTEWVKGMAWQGIPIGPFDDVVITAQQLRAESILYGKVDFVVTDSPIGLGAVYEQFRRADHGVMWALTTALRQRQLAAGIRIVDCLLQRTKPFVAAGRYETEDEAKRVDRLCAEHLQVLCGLSGYHVVQDAADVLRAAGARA